MHQQAYSHNGISLLAIGDPSYGKWASQLSLSIRFYEKDLPIQLITDHKATSHLQKWQLDYFDEVTTIKTDHAYTDGRLNPSYAKLNIYEYLKYDNTIYLDVDAVCINGFSDLFTDDPYKVFTWGVTYQEDGMYPNMLWLEIGKMRKWFYLPDQPIPGTNSSYQYIRKGKTTERIFADALDYYHSFTAEHGPDELDMKWGKKTGRYTYPDELFLNASLAKNHSVDYVMQQQPIKFFTPHYKGKPVTLSVARQDGYRFIGFWGDQNYSTKEAKELYDALFWNKYTPGMRHEKIHRLFKRKFVNTDGVRL